jgi:cysteine desulfurase
MKASRVLAAMGTASDLASSFLRVSFGPATSEADIDRFLAQWREVANRAKSVAA